MSYWINDELDVLEVGDKPRGEKKSVGGIVIIAYQDPQQADEFISINQDSIEEIKSLRELEDNWDDEGAKAPNEAAIAKALGFVEILSSSGQEIFNVGPGPNGEVLVDLRNPDNSKSLEFLFYKDHAVVVRFDDNAGMQDDFDEKNLSALLQWLNG